MKAKLTDIKCDYLAHYLGLSSNMEIYDFIMKADDNEISWSENGLDYIRFTINWRVDKDDITIGDEVRLTSNHNGYECGNYIDGAFMVNTKITDNDFEISFPEIIDGSEFEVNVNFLDNTIEVI